MQQTISQTDSAHGHTILRWLAVAPMTTEALRQRVSSELGEAVQFHTCDVANLSLDALLSLLAERGKVVRCGAVWTADVSKMCADE